jgi:hypothetical protein
MIIKHLAVLAVIVPLLACGGGDCGRMPEHRMPRQARLSDKTVLQVF